MPTRANPWRQIRYRAGQFFGGFRARVSAEEIALVAGLLPPDAAVLFGKMPVDAQRHSLNVLHMLHDEGIDQSDLAAAALLHDVGKAAATRLGLWWRGPLVALETISPATLHRMADDSGAGWRYLIYVHLEHPRIGAEWARQAGCSSLTCWLIEQHQTPGAPGANHEDEELLCALQWADSRN